MFLRVFQFVLIGVSAILGFTGVISVTIAVLAAGLAGAALGLEFLPGKQWDRFVAEGATLMEALAIVVVAASLHQVAAMSALVLIPVLFRRDRYVENMLRVSGLAAAFILFGSWSVTSGVVPAWPELAAAVAVAAVGAVASLESVKTVIHPAAPISTPFAAEPALAFPDEQRILEYRESYRRLKGMYEGLLRRSDSDRASMCLVDWRFGDARSIRELAHALRNAAEVDGAAIYTVPDIRDGMVLAGASGTAPAEARTLQVPVQAAQILIRERATEALNAIRKTETTACENVILLDRGRLVGLAALYDDSRERIVHGRKILEDLSPLLARLLRDEQEAEALRIRAIRAELLADLGTRYLDSSKGEASNGIAEDLVANLKLAGCSISFRVDGSFREFGQGGASPEAVFEALMMGQSSGLDGWAESGARELVIPEARQDVRFDRLVAIRKGVGMLAILPLFSSGSLVGALTAWTEEAHGLNSVVLGTLRAVIPHILRRCYGGFPTTRPGLVDQETFSNGSQGPGSFIEINLGQTEALDGRSPELTQARRRLLALVVSKLPQGGLLTRWPNGNLVVFLAGFDEKTTKSWTQSLQPNADPTWGMAIKILGFSPQSIQFLRQVPA